MKVNPEYNKILAEALVKEDARKESVPMSVIEDIMTEITAELDNRPSFEFDEWTAGFNDGIRTALDIIDKHIGKENE